MKKQSANQKLPKSALIALIGIIALLGLALIVNLTAIGIAQARSNRLGRQINDMETELSYIDNALSNPPSDRCIEDYARENLGMHNPGDKAFVVG